MEYRPLDITVLSAEGLKNVNLFMKMGVYVVVSLNDDSISEKKTHTSSSGSNPKWNHRIKITLEESSIYKNYLLFQIKCNRVLGDKDIGEVLIPICELLDGVGTIDNVGDNVVTYAVRTLNGKCKGNLKFSYKFGEVFVQGGETAQNNKKNKNDGSVRNRDDGSQRNRGDGSVKGYATSNASYQPQSGGLLYALPQPGAGQYPHAGYPGPHGYPTYPPLQYGGMYNNVYPPGPPGPGGCSGEFPRTSISGYPYHPGPGGYSGEFPRTSISGYPYQPQQVGYWYSGELPKQQVQQPKHQTMGNATKLGLGLGAAGLIGGLLVGEMISDIGDMAAAGCNAGLEDAVAAE